MSSLAIHGNLAADVVLRFTPNGKAVATFTVVENTRRMGRQGWEGGEPNTWQVQAWEGLAENIAESTATGSPVVVIGTMSTERWTDKETGAPRSKQVIKADHVGFDLRWYTVNATRATRAQGQQQSQGTQAQQQGQPANWGTDPNF